MYEKPEALPTFRQREDSRYERASPERKHLFVLDELSNCSDRGVLLAGGDTHVYSSSAYIIAAQPGHQTGKE